MRLCLLGLLAASACHSQVITGNFSVDLYGPLDTRLPNQSCNVGPCIWGHADSYLFPIPFAPPSGQQVKIESIKGNLIAGIKTLAGDPVTPPESMAYVLIGFELPSYSPTPNCSYCYLDVPLYLQGTLSEKQPGVTIPFNYDHVGQLLGTDNVLQVKLAEFLNNTGKPIHLEGTWTIRYKYVSQ
jgi:hypothetical protein